MNSTIADKDPFAIPDQFMQELADMKVKLELQHEAIKLLTSACTLLLNEFNDKKSS